MSGKIVYLVNTEKQILGMGVRTRDLIVGNESLHSRLIGQLKKRGLSLRIINESEIRAAEDFPTFFDDCVYSGSLIQRVLTENWVFKSGSKSRIQTHGNSVIGFDKGVDAVAKRSMDFDLCHPAKFQIDQVVMMKIPLRLPEAIYPEKNYHVPLPDIFFQRIHDWPDLLKAQSLICRESTIATVSLLRPWMSAQFLERLMNVPALASRSNKIGRRCRIHPTAILESCIVGNDVEIGAFCFLRGAVIGDQVTIREQSSIKVSVIGKGSYILPCDIFNCYIGTETVISTHILFHCVVGNATFIGGGVGFADLNANRSNIRVTTEDSLETTDQMFLGSMVGRHCFIGAGLLFQSGQRVAYGSTILNYQMIQKSDFKDNQFYIAQGNRVTQIPKQFLKESTTV